MGVSGSSLEEETVQNISQLLIKESVYSQSHKSLKYVKIQLNNAVQFHFLFCYRTSLLNAECGNCLSLCKI